MRLISTVSQAQRKRGARSLLRTGSDALWLVGRASTGGETSGSARWAWLEWRRRTRHRRAYLRVTQESLSLQRCVSRRRDERFSSSCDSGQEWGAGHLAMPADSDGPGSAEAGPRRAGCCGALPIFPSISDRAPCAGSQRLGASGWPLLSFPKRMRAVESTKRGSWPVPRDSLYNSWVGTVQLAAAGPRLRRLGCLRYNLFARRTFGDDPFAPVSRRTRRSRRSQSLEKVNRPLLAQHHLPCSELAEIDEAGRAPAVSARYHSAIRALRIA